MPEKPIKKNAFNKKQPIVYTQIKIQYSTNQTVASIKILMWWMNVIDLDEY
jgi:hypothetical protein